MNMRPMAGGGVFTMRMRAIIARFLGRLQHLPPRHRAMGRGLLDRPA